MSQPQQSHNKKTKQKTQNQLPSDIHSGVLSPQTSIRSKAAAIGLMSAKLASTQDPQSSNGRKVQTVHRDHNSKNRTQRSTSRSNMNDIRGIRTDRRDEIDNHHYFQRPDSREMTGLSGTHSISMEESKETASISESERQRNTQRDVDVRFNKQQMSNIGNSNRLGQQSNHTLRESHESMRSLQKQRIQRSLQKSQEGRKKLEEKLDAISKRDQATYDRGGPGQSTPQNHLLSSVSTAVASNHADGRTVDRFEKLQQRFEDSRNSNQNMSSASLLAMRGGFSNLRNKDQIRDQMLASINKIKSFRETGEFEITAGLTQGMPSLTGSMTQGSDRMIGLSDVGINIEEPQDAYHSNVRDRCSDQVIIGETTISHGLRQTPGNDRNSVYDHERGLGNTRDNDRASYQTHDQSTFSADNFNNISTLQNFQSTKSNTALDGKNIGSQLHMINNQIENKICNNIEAAQPFLKMCLIGSNSTRADSSMNGANDQSSQFTSISDSTVDLDKNLICPKCSFIVVHPVECQSCQYIICFKCAQANSGTCDDERCGEKFTKTPGKIHKLYKTMLNQLEFRCPNQAQGCCQVLKYDQLDNHLQRECEARQMQCPNRCQKNLKFSHAELQKHLDSDCPKECLPCPQCKQIKFRMEIEEHLQKTCDKVLIRCPACNQEDYRLSLSNGKHQCERSHPLKESSSLRGSQDLTNEMRPRNFEDFHNVNRSQQEEDGVFETERNSRLLLTGPVTQAQLKIVKDDLQSVENLITGDVFQMIDNLSQALTEKESDVQDIKKGVEEQRSDKLELQDKNKRLEQQIFQQSQQYQQIQTQMVQQSDNFEELINNINLKQNHQMKKFEEINTQMFQKMTAQNLIIEEYENKITDLQKRVNHQTQRLNEMLNQTSVSFDEHQKMILTQDEYIKSMTDHIQGQMKLKEKNEEGNENLVKEVEDKVDIMQLNHLKNTQQINDKISFVQDKLQKDLAQVYDVIMRQDTETSNFQKFVIEQVKASQQQREQVQNSPVPQVKIKSPAPKSQNFIDEEDKMHESNVSESLDDQIYKEHYEQSKAQNQQFQRNLLVPPIDLAGSSKTKKSQNSISRRKSPKHHKHYSEDIKNKQVSKSPMKFENTEQRRNFELEEQIRKQLYPSEQVPEESVENEIDELFNSNNVQVINEGKKSKTQAIIIKDKEQNSDLLNKLDQSEEKSHSPKKRQSSDQRKKKQQQVILDEIDDDIDESQFIPEYLSSTENEMTYMNRTELGTEFNTARPLNGGYGEQTDRQTDRQSTMHSKRGSARGFINNGNQGFNSVPAGGLTDRQNKNRLLCTSDVLTQSSNKKSASPQMLQESNIINDYSLNKTEEVEDDNQLPNIETVEIFERMKNHENPSKKNADQGLQENGNGSGSGANLIKEEEQLVLKSEQSSNDSFVNESEAPCTEPQSTRKLAAVIPNLDSQRQNKSEKDLDVKQRFSEEKKSQKANDMPRPSITSNKTNPYRDSFVKTYESSEFQDQCAEILPGNIFCMDGGFGAGQQLPADPFAVQQPMSSAQRESNISSTKDLTSSKMQSSLDKKNQLLESMKSSKMSVGDLQVNLGDQNFNKFYALAQNNQLQNESQGVHNRSNQSILNTVDRTRSLTKVEGKISEMDQAALMKKSSFEMESEDLNPYSQMDSGNNSLMTKTLKINKMMQENMIEQMVDPKAIENDIFQLQQKYENEEMLMKSFKQENSELQDDKQDLKKTVNTLNTDERINLARKDLEKTTSQDDIMRSSHMNSIKQKKQKGVKQNVLSSSDNDEFDRDDVSNGENLDNIINQVLDGDHLFKHAKPQQNSLPVNENSDKRLQKQESGGKMPFEIGSKVMPFELGSKVQSPCSDNDSQNNTQNEIDEILQKNHIEPMKNSGPRQFQQTSQDGDSERDNSNLNIEKQSSDNSKQDLDQSLTNNNQQLPTGLESDLETILETDQESNYMTTARTGNTNQQKPGSGGGNQMKNIQNQINNSKNCYEYSQMPFQQQISQCNQTMDKPQLDQSMNQSINQTFNQSLNNSSFFIPETAANLPSNIYSTAPAENNKAPEKILTALVAEVGENIATDEEKRDNVSDDSEDKAMFKTHKKSSRGNSGGNSNGDVGNMNSMMLNDISPIGHAMNQSQFLGSGYTNILDSTQQRARKDSLNDKTESRKENNIGDSDTNEKMADVDIPSMNPYKMRYHREDMDQKIQRIAQIAASQPGTTPDRLVNQESPYPHADNEPSFLASDRSNLQSAIDVDQIDVGVIGQGLIKDQISSHGNQDVDVSHQEKSEQRIRSYQEKVLNAITFSAKKKQKEQNDIYQKIQQEQQIKRLNSLKSVQEEENEEQMVETTAGRSYLESQMNPNLKQQYGKDQIDQELKLIIQRNRQIYEQKHGQEGGAEQLSNAFQEQHGDYWKAEDKGTGQPDEQHQ